MSTLSSVNGTIPESFSEKSGEELIRIRWWKNFHEALYDSEKSDGRCKSHVAMEEFRKVVSDMALVDVKTNRG